jgi:hypothetical protein
MIYLLPLPFVALVVGIVVVRVMRTWRQVATLQASRSPMGPVTEGRKPSDEFHDNTWLPLCERVAALARSKLGRPLTAKERRTIWRSRSVLVLEVALKELESIAVPGAAAALLAQLPAGMDRPDPTGWCAQPCGPT